MGGQVHSVDRVPHTHNTLCNKEQGRDTGWVGSRHNRRHKQLRFFPIKSGIQSADSENSSSQNSVRSGGNHILEIFTWHGKLIPPIFTF